MIREVSAALAEAWGATSWVEVAGAALAVAYLLLVIREHVLCWAAAFVSSCLYVWVLFGAHLYMESVLNGFFAAMAVYGYLRWRRGADGVPPPVRRWRLSWHAAGLAGALLLSLLTSQLLRRYTPAAWPFVDSLVTWASAFATFLVARKVYENWHWWLVIDSVSLLLYFMRHLYVTMALYALYLVMIVGGMRAWRASLGAAPRAA